MSDAPAPAPTPVASADLCWRVPAEALALPDAPPPPAWLPGQAEAREGLARAVAAGRSVVVSGLSGPWRRARVAEALAPLVPAPAARRDLVYVVTPSAPERPRALALPPGRGASLRLALHRLRRELDGAWPDPEEGGIHDAPPEAWRAALARPFAPLLADLDEESPDAAAWLRELQAAVQARDDLFRPGEGLGRRADDGDPDALALQACFELCLFDPAPPADAPGVLQADDLGPAQLLGGLAPAPKGASAPAHLRLRPGILHQAHGRWLVLDLDDLLAVDGGLDALCTLLRTGRLRPGGRSETPERVTPEPAPVDLRVALILGSGAALSRWRSDRELRGLISRPVQLRPHHPFSPALVAEWAGWLAARADRPLAPEAVAAVIEDLVREGGRGGRVPSRYDHATALLDDAAFLAGDEAVLSAEAVRAALDRRRRQRGGAARRAADAIEAGFIHVETTGRAVGQVNGLAVYRGSGFAFARPIRVTATAGVGRGGLVDVERDAGLSGKSFQKGTRLYTGLLRGRFSRRRTLAIQATVAIEQHYGQIDGDSASLAAACALVSAIADVPVAQGVAVTGSVDQLGRVNSVGSVTRKVEGFFDICRRAGLSAEVRRGVIVPAVNVGDLCLSDEVVAAVQAGTFAVWPVSTFEEALALLVEGEVGDPAAEAWPEDSLYGRVDAALAAHEQTNRRAAKGPGAS